ncbi:hypothetical protein PV08_11720 [Exophiala spinifera]|uniref:Short chain type dehydrogenase n=1 Tax=Exophiala spinifera TaxID=91928 RepID=A0A0D2BF20_9EURO|nr:uncharacterized protein PV08_11720 [Exophiala spinifera]KIW09944.1 hypothetical protein PV08_11720 [Exophiala spinifera]
MAAVSPVILILGAGPNIGQAVARTFALKGYKVALAARSTNEAESTDRQLNITSDFSRPDDVVKAFKKVTSTFGIPSVVVYNVSASTFTPAKEPFALQLADLDRDLHINVVSAFVAAQQAVSGFAQLPASASKTFIYTGNILNVNILPAFIDQGMGKSAGAHMIWAASAAFYYGDERKADGSPIYKVSGEAHAKHYWELAEDKSQGPWLQTFVNGVGYTKFDGPSL